MHGVDEFAEVFFDDVVVPGDRMLGRPGDGWRVAMDLLPYERSTCFWHRIAYLYTRLDRLLAATARSGRGRRSAPRTWPCTPPAAARRVTQRRLAAGDRLGPGDLGRQGAAGHGRAAAVRHRPRPAARGARADRLAVALGVPVLAGGDDLRRHRRDPAQHHRPPAARPGERSDDAVDAATTLADLLADDAAQDDDRGGRVRPGPGPRAGRASAGPTARPSSPRSPSRWCSGCSARPARTRRCSTTCCCTRPAAARRHRAAAVRRRLVGACGNAATWVARPWIGDLPLRPWRTSLHGACGAREVPAGAARRGPAGARLVADSALAGPCSTLARSHALDRTQFGRPVASFQAVRHRLAETLVALDGAEATLRRRLGRTSARLLAKAAAGQAALTAARHCQQVLGGIGLHRRARPAPPRPPCPRPRRPARQHPRTHPRSRPPHPRRRLSPPPPPPLTGCMQGHPIGGFC